MEEPAAGADDAGLASVVRDVLEQHGVTDALTLAEVVVLYRDHPRWSIWMPVAGGEWAAVRPAGSRPPGPEVPMLWVHAGTAADLGGRMSRADERLFPPGQC